ncbi:peroxiredoxin [Anseongella ginsenosidimutans]|uniref:Peroxiredoxin n=1 Tax=Anseongella ginsenosidimutans TaxID=496056 RepID=A0A4R3KQP5_9SPHI|nr:redoxin domain-containing protein [Anseongella ginsenosidimutans]QEC53944.1 redoxin domain-containing protein [Anseongella ginsenosidimutans]TCS86331.1 peroxiredoxin [Anseongella ginsenosidimutans]
MRLFSIPITFFTIACFWSCNPAPAGKQEKNEAVKGGFTANPQEVPGQEVQTLEIGEPAPDFNLPGVDGKFYQLSDFDEAKVLAIIFTCNHCPTAQAYEERIKKIVVDYGEKGVALVAISPNSPIGLLPEECGYTDLGDTYEEMKIRARDHDFNFPYLYDGDTHEASVQYGPVATPHAFVFDQERKLRYVGRIDNSEKPGTGHAEDLRNALDALLEEREVAVPETKTFGCSTKWAWKNHFAVEVNEKWAASPVSLEEIDEAGIRSLLKNDSDKLRLINLWATWCGPCIIEYPELVTVHRMFMGRDFEFISLSADNPAQKDKALKFLEEKNSVLKNYIFNKEDKYALIEAIDSEWDGALPYTVLVEPGGKVVYRQQGPVDLLELKRAIVDHPMIGRYY